MSTVNTTDLMLINRANVDYKVSVADLKKAVGSGGVYTGPTAPPTPTNGMMWVDTGGPEPVLKIWDAGTGKWVYAQTYMPVAPDITSILVADVAGGGRFTSTSFPVTFTMANDGQPPSYKEIKAKVQGSIVKESVVGTVGGIGTATVDFLAGRTNQASDWGAALSNGANFGATWNTPYVTDFGPILDGNLATGVTVDGSVNKSQTSIYAFNNPFPGSGKLEVYVDITQNNPGIPAANFAFQMDGNPNGWVPQSWHGVVTTGSQWVAIGSGRVSGFCIIKNWSDGNNIVIKALRYNGVILNHATSVTNVTITTTGSLTAVDGQVIHGKTSGAVGTVMSLAGNVAQVLLNTGSPPFQAGEDLVVKTGVPGTTLYCQISATGAVTNLLTADPGYVKLSGAPPYTLQFPATMPTGGPPDDELSAGVTLTVDGRATNGAGSDTETSNVLTPT